MKQEEKEYAVFIQGNNSPYGFKAGDIVWVKESDSSSVEDGELILCKYSKHGEAFGIVVGDTVESLSVDDIYELSECKIYRLEDEELRRVAKGMTTNLNPLAYPHYENV